MAEEKKGFFRRLVAGLTKTRDSIVSGFDSIFSGYSSIDDDFYDEIEEILVMGDIGITATTSIIDNLSAIRTTNLRTAGAWFWSWALTGSARQPASENWRECSGMKGNA